MDKITPPKKSLKKYIVPIAILGAIAVAYGAYTIPQVNNNVKQMNASNETQALYFPSYPITDAKAPNAELIKKGEYLTKAGDCIACHTNTALREKSQPFAGGLVMTTPFGRIYSPNITPDKETGIGKWTFEQFETAMRKGISPQGHYYYPAFPYLYFSKFTTDDLKAIKAYLDNIPAVQQQNRDNEMLFPFNIRLLQLGWRILFFHGSETTVFEPSPALSDELNRGKYIVDGPGHCAMCHTPSYNIFSENLPLAAPIRKYDLTGAKVQGYLAPNISKSNIGTVPDAEVIDVFTKDKLIGGGNVVGPMLEVNHDSLKYLTDTDLNAMSRYLKTVDSQTPPKPKSSGGPGAGTYDTYCAGCHATGAGGAPKFGDSTSWATVTKSPLATIYTHAIKGINGMPAKGTCISCSDDEIKAAVDYMIASTQGDSGSKTAVAVPAPKKLTLADGKRLYTENCAVCHNTGFKKAPKPGDVAAWKTCVNKGFYATYKDIISGKDGHLPNAACPTCTDGDIIAALKYMMQESAPNKDYSLW